MVSTLRSGAELQCECACRGSGNEKGEKRGWFEVARPRRNDGTRTTVGGWVDGWLVGRKGRTAAKRGWRKGNE